MLGKKVTEIFCKRVKSPLASPRANLVSARANAATLVHDFGVDKATKAKLPKPL